MKRNVPGYIISGLHKQFQQIVSEIMKLRDDTEDGNVAKPLQEIKVDAVGTKCDTFTDRQSVPRLPKNDRPFSREEC